MDFIEKTATRECPGGLYGCAINSDNDMRCRAGAKYFLDRNALTDAMSRIHSSMIFVFICSMNIILRWEY